MFIQTHYLISFKGLVLSLSLSMCSYYLLNYETANTYRTSESREITYMYRYSGRNGRGGLNILVMTLFLLVLGWTHFWLHLE